MSINLIKIAKYFEKVGLKKDAQLTREIIDRVDERKIDTDIRTLEYIRDNYDFTEKAKDFFDKKLDSLKILSAEKEIKKLSRFLYARGLSKHLGGLQDLIAKISSLIPNKTMDGLNKKYKRDIESGNYDFFDISEKYINISEKTLSKKYAIVRHSFFQQVHGPKTKSGEMYMLVGGIKDLDENLIFTLFENPEKK